MKNFIDVLLKNGFKRTFTIDEIKTAYCTFLEKQVESVKEKRILERIDGMKFYQIDNPNSRYNRAIVKSNCKYNLDGLCAAYLGKQKIFMHVKFLKELK